MSATLDLKPIEQVLRVAIAIEIDVVKWMAVPRQKFLHAQRSRAVREPIDDDVTQIARNHAEPALDERPHQNLTQLRVGLDEREELLAIELDHFARLADAQSCDRAAPGDHVAFA